MVRNDPTKRRHGGISARFGLSACILVPPLLMAAGIAFFDAFAPQNGSPQPAAQPAAERQVAAPQSIVAKTVSAAERPDAGSSFALANAEVRPVITDKRPLAEWFSGTEPTGATEPRPGGRAAAATDPAPYYGPVPVTVVHIRKAGGPPEMADLDAAAAAPIVKISQNLATITGRNPQSRGLSCQRQDWAPCAPQHSFGKAAAQPHAEPRGAATEHPPALATEVRAAALPCRRPAEKPRGILRTDSRSTAA